MICFAVMFAGVDGLIVVIIIAIFSAISTWVQRRKQRQDGESQPGGETTQHDWDWANGSPPAPGHPPKTPAESWEEELKRLLGQPTEAPPPPVVVVKPPPPSPPPLVVVRQESPRSVAFPPAPVLRETIASRPSLEEQEIRVTPPSLGSLRESQAAYSSASHPGESVAAQIDQVSKHRVAMTHAEHQDRLPPEIRAAVAMLRHPRTARQAFVVSQIFGAPRALEPLH